MSQASEEQSRRLKDIGSELRTHYDALDAIKAALAALVVRAEQGGIRASGVVNDLVEAVDNVDAALELIDNVVAVARDDDPAEEFEDE